MSDVRFWDKIAAKYATDPVADPDAYAETRARMAEILQPEHRVLELGCGTGTTALELAGGVGDYLATDLSPAMIAIAEGKRGPDTPASLRFAVAPAAELPEGPFDVILALNVLHLVPDLEGLVARIFDALPPGGCLIAKTALISDGAWFLPLLIPPMRAIGKAPWVRNLSGAELEGILTATGFTVEDSLLQPDTAPRLFQVARKP